MRTCLSHVRAVLAAGTLVVVPVVEATAAQIEESPVLEAHGDERLTWEQDASSSEEVAALRFVAYVNGRRQALPFVSCPLELGAGRFECWSPLPPLGPGVHVIEIAAYDGGGARQAEVRSAPIRVRLGAATVRSGGRADAPEHVDTPSTDQMPSLDRSWTTSDGVRLRAMAVASGLDDATDLLPLPDGRILVAERAGYVRVFRDGVLLGTAAATLDDVAVGDGRGLLALAADRAFPSTGHVFAAYTTDEGLRIVRFTAFGDTLVDRAVLLDGLPVAAVQPAALLRSGPDGRLYVALDDAGDPRRLADMGSYNGKVLRIATDGTTPDDQPGRSPVWSIGVGHPIGLAWSVGRETLRLVGVDRRDDPPGQASSHVGPDSGGHLTRFTLAPDVGARAATGAGSSPHAFRDELLVASADEHAILRVWFAERDIPGGSEWLLRDLPGPVTSLGVGHDGAIYATVGQLLLRIIAE